MADIDWTLSRPQTPFQLPQQNLGQQFVAGAQAGSQIGLQQSEAAKNYAGIPLLQAQTASTQAEVPLKGAQTQSTLADVPLKGAETQSALAEVPLKAAQTQSALADVPYKQALAEQAKASAGLMGTQSAVAKAGLINDIMAGVSDDQTYANAKASLNELGMPTSSMPDTFDPAFIAQKQATSSHYLDLVKAQAEIEMKKFTFAIQAGQLNMELMSKGIPPMYPTTLPTQGINMPGTGAGNPAIGSPQPGQAQMTSPGALGQGFGGMPMQPQGGAQLPPGAQQPIGPGSFPAYLAQQQALGSQSAQQTTDQDTAIAKSVANAPTILENIGVVRDGLAKGIQPGKWTGPGRELFSPGAAQELDKGVSNMFTNVLTSLGGTGVGRLMQSEIKVMVKGLPANMTQKEINSKIVDITEAGVRVNEANANAYTKLRQMGYTDQAQIQNILNKTIDNVGVFNSKNGTVRMDNLQHYDDAFNYAIQGKSMINDDTVQQTVDAHPGMTRAQVIQQLKANGADVSGVSQ